jgi:hypothetical protein
MSASMPFEPLLASGPSGHNHNHNQDQEPITTRPRRKLTLSDRIDIFIDRTSGKLGPVLIVTAVILLSMTIYCFFAVFIPFHYPRQPEGEETASHVGYVANMVWSCYLVWGILANYYYAVNTSPGSVVDGISSENVRATTHWTVNIFVRFLSGLSMELFFTQRNAVFVQIAKPVPKCSGRDGRYAKHYYAKPTIPPPSPTCCDLVAAI